jgi:hypothetical protein
MKKMTKKLKSLPSQDQMNKEKIMIKPLLTSNNQKSLPIEVSTKEILQSRKNSPQDPKISKSKFPPMVEQYSQEAYPSQLLNTKKSQIRGRKTLLQPKQNLQDLTIQKETLIEEIQIPKDPLELKELSPSPTESSKLKCGNQCKSSLQKELQSEVNQKPSGPTSPTLFGQFWSKLWGRAKTSSYFILSSSPSSKASKKPQEKTASKSKLFKTSSITDSTFLKPALVKETNPSLSKNLT